MSLRGGLRDRRLPATIVVVALAAGLSQLLLWWMGPPAPTRDFVGPPRSGYTLTDASLTSYNLQGQPAFHITTPHLERREGDASLYLNAPVFELLANQPGVPAWHGRSLYGWVDKSGSLLKLQGPVTMFRPAFNGTARTEMHTADVTAWPRQNRMRTAAAARMVQGGTTINGIGMRADLNDQHLELLHDVHATFPPRQRQP